MINMKLLLLLLISLSCGYAQAAIYKWTLPDGTVVFSDQPHPDAEEIDVPKAQTFTPPPGPVSTEPPIIPKQESAVGYISVAITTPANDATIRENSGKVEVHVACEPPLQAQEGHTIVIRIDGHTIGNPATTQQYVLDNIDRGTHILQASILDASGKTLIESETVTFHLQRFSTLLKQNPAVGG